MTAIRTGDGTCVRSNAVARAPGCAPAPVRRALPGPAEGRRIAGCPRLPARSRDMISGPNQRPDGRPNPPSGARCRTRPLP